VAVAEGIALGTLVKPHDFRLSQMILLDPHQDGPSKIVDVITPPGPVLGHAAFSLDGPVAPFT